MRCLLLQVQLVQVRLDGVVDGSLASHLLLMACGDERLGVPIMTVYAWNSRGGGPRFMKFGKHVRYKIVNVDAWEDEHYAESVAG